MALVAEKWKRQMKLLLVSMEQLDDIRLRIKAVESNILAFAKKTEESPNGDDDRGETALVRLLEETQLLIEDVEIKINQLDMRLSAIERLVHE